MAKKTEIECKCERCGRPQTKDESKSNKNWSAFQCGQMCECGGKFVMYINVQKMG